MTRQLIIMRHAKSSWDYPELTDHDRPLNKRGIKDSPKIAKSIQKLGWSPDRILVSSSKRTIETMDGLTTVFGAVPYEVRPRIYHATLPDLIEELEILKEGTTMIIGHNPGSELLVQYLSQSWHEMPTATAVLLFESEKNWKIFQIIRPKEIK